MSNTHSGALPQGRDAEPFRWRKEVLMEPDTVVALEQLMEWMEDLVRFFVLFGVGGIVMLSILCMIMVMHGSRKR